MSNLSMISDSDLLQKTKQCVAYERQATAEVLNHLCEVNSRRLFAARGFPSHFDFATIELGYSAGAAYRRIGAMRLLHCLPASEKIAVAKALDEGRVSLSTLSSVQSFCRAEKIPDSEKFDLVQKTLGKSQRETDRLLASISPEPFKKEKLRPLSETLTELRITLTGEQMAKLERAKEILSNQASSWAEVFEVLADQLIKKSQPKERELKKAAPLKNPEPGPAPELATGNLKSRYISRPLKRQKLAKAQHQCEYVDPVTGRSCSARDHLEFDHILPHARGGTTDEANLRVYCRAHNQFAALKSFGKHKMEKHWAKPSQTGCS